MLANMQDILFLCTQRKTINNDKWMQCCMASNEERNRPEGSAMSASLLQQRLTAQLSIPWSVLNCLFVSAALSFFCLAMQLRAHPAGVI